MLSKLCFLAPHPHCAPLGFQSPEELITMDSLRQGHDGGGPDMYSMFDGFPCSNPTPRVVVAISIVNVGVAILNLQSPRFQESGLSLRARITWVLFWLSFVVASFHEACWFTAVACWGLGAFNPLRAGPHLGIAQTLLDGVIFILMLVGALLLLAFLVAAVSIVAYFKLASAFRRERPYASGKPMLGYATTQQGKC